MEGSGLSLPLNLANIAARCKGSYYAPRRFAAVQLAFHSPRARVLVFRKCYNIVLLLLLVFSHISCCSPVHVLQILDDW